MTNIDWDFIKEQEGTQTTGYVPDAENSKSGVTIASGFDLGARCESDLEGLPTDIIQICTPYLGLKGEEAVRCADTLKISERQASVIDAFSKREATSRLKKKWELATNTSFDDLPKSQATVIASVAFQYGDLASKTPNFWKQITGNDWDGAVNNLRNFGDKYSSRRNREADYLLGL